MPDTIYYLLYIYHIVYTDLDSSETASPVARALFGPGTLAAEFDVNGSTNCERADGKCNLATERWATLGAH